MPENTPQLPSIQAALPSPSVTPSSASSTTSTAKANSKRTWGAADEYGRYRLLQHRTRNGGNGMMAATVEYAGYTLNNLDLNQHRPTLSDNFVRPKSPPPNSFQGIYLQYERQAGSKAWLGGGGGSSSMAMAVAMTAAQLRTKKRDRKKAPDDQRLLGPAIPGVGPFEGKTRMDDGSKYGAQGHAAKAAQRLLKVPSQYHHSNLDSSTVLIDDYQTASSDIYYCPSSKAHGEGKSFSYLRAVRKITPVESTDTRRDAKGFWHFKKHTTCPRKAIVRETFWSNTHLSV